MFDSSIYKQLLTKDPAQKDSLNIITSQCQLMASHWKENINKEASVEMMAEIKEEVQDQFGISLSMEDVKLILALYPKFRIDLCTWGLGDTPTRESLSDLITDFFLHCNHPDFGHNLSKEELNEFYLLIKSQAKACGFKTT